MSQNVSTAVMNRRVEPDDSLDDFPTQPWATRALIEHVLKPELGLLANREMQESTVWEPSCNRGHMVKPLSEYFRRVFASDIYDYSAEWPGQERVVDFLWRGSESPHMATVGVNWVITNPPFRLAEQFIRRSFEMPGWRGTAVIVRTSFIEGVGRFENLFSKRPPALVAQFTERVPMVKGRLTATGSTATAYCWLVWLENVRQGTELVWIPPCRRELERPGDYPA